MRAALAEIIAAVAFGVIGVGLAHLQLVQGAGYAQMAARNCVRVIPQSGARGRILDCQGRVMVANRLSYDVTMSATSGSAALATLRTVAGWLDESVETLRQRFNANFVSRSIPALVAANIPVSTAIAVQERSTRLPQIRVQPHPVRQYPHGSLACHLIGYLGEIDYWRVSKLEEYGYKNKDTVGYTGLEERYDYYVRQREGGTILEVNHQGSVVRILGVEPPIHGTDIRLTIDLTLQGIIEEQLVERVGSIIIMDPGTGQIRALASSPGYQPADFLAGSRSAIAGYVSDARAPLVNRAISGVYPSASVFKLVVAAAALETGKITPATSYVCTGGLTLGGKRFGCWETHGREDLTAALAHSCDVYFYRTGMALGVLAIREYALKFGFGHTTGIELPYEAAGFIPDPAWKRMAKREPWYEGDTLNISIGQGDVLVTPLQTVRMVAAFANGGKLVTPYLVEAIGERTVGRQKQRASSLPFKPATIAQIREGMRQVVVARDGTAAALAELPVAVAGKTGTAQVSQGLAHGWFAGFFPYDAPRYSICVFLEHGGSGSAAVAVVREVLIRMRQEGLI